MTNWVRVARTTDCPPGCGVERIAEERDCVVAHTRGRIQALELPLGGAADEAADAFLLKVTAVQARAEDPAVLDRHLGSGGLECRSTGAPVCRRGCAVR